MTTPAQDLPAVVLSPQDVDRLLDMPGAIDVMAACLAGLGRGEYDQPLRTVHPLPWGAGFGVMPGWRTAPTPAFALKATSKVAANAERGMAPHQGVVLLCNGVTGQPRAIVPAGVVTAWRTAAATGVATRLLARDDATTLAIVGAGVQARSHLEAMLAVRPFDTVRIWGPTRARAEALCAEARTRHDVSIAVADDVEAAVRDADVVVTVTSSAEPVLRREWLAPGALVDAVGSSRAQTRELDTATVAAATVFADVRESVLAESGDFLLAAAEAGLGAEHVRGDLGEVLTGACAGRTAADELIVFASVGVAAEDLALVAELETRARAAGVGTLVHL